MYIQSVRTIEYRYLISAKNTYKIESTYPIPMENSRQKNTSIGNSNIVGLILI